MSAIGCQFDVAPTGLKLIRGLRAIKMPLLRSWVQQAGRAGIFIAILVWWRLSSIGAPSLRQARINRYFDVAPPGLELIRGLRNIKMPLLRSWVGQARRAGIFIATVVRLGISSVGAPSLWQARINRYFDVAPLGLELIRGLRAIKMPLLRSWVETPALDRIAMRSSALAERDFCSLRFFSKHAGRAISQLVYFSK